MHSWIPPEFHFSCYQASANGVDIIAGFVTFDKIFLLAKMRICISYKTWEYFFTLAFASPVVKEGFYFMKGLVGRMF